jgi:hypothetical protein
MTFTEAALEVLRSAGEPLHYKKITELAIAGNLLSHVGKTPEVTMSSRLATLVKKDRGQSPIVKVRPGVFTLRESAMDTDKDPSAQPSQSEQPESSEQKSEVAPVERPPLPGADVFPEEADDDFPILAGLEEETGEDRSRRRRRRRRRSGKGPEPLGAEPAAPANPRNGGRGDREPRDIVRHEPVRHDSVRHDAGRHEPPRSDGGRHDRNAGRRDGGRVERDNGRFERRDREPQQGLDFNRQPAEGDLLGKDLADAAYHVLSRGDRAPASFARVAEMLVRRGRLSGLPDALAPTVAAALRADAARAQRAHSRPRFRIVAQRVSLTEWLLPREAVRSQENVEQSAEMQRDQIRRAFVGRVNDLPAAGFAELVATWLNAEGVTALRAVRRPGSSGREFHFAGTLRRGAEENRLAFVVLRAGRDIDRETVVEARGSLHHYGAATGAWLVTTGRINGTAREEAAAEGAAACALFGGSDLARAMEELGIGIRKHHVPLCDIDFDLLESLGDTGQPQVRREREDQAPRERQHGRDRGRERGPREGAADGSAPALDADEGSAAAEGERTTPIDLFDAEAAEASRLVPAAQTWQPEGEGNGEGESEEDSELEARPTVRLAPPIRIGDSAGHSESADEGTEAEEPRDEDDSADALADDDEVESSG